MVAEDDCCSDCTPGSLSEHGQAGPIPTGPIADNEDKAVAPAAPGDCCSDCDLNCPSTRGQVYPVGIGPNAENKDNIVTSGETSCASI